jgi:hypothetical protein
MKIGKILHSKYTTYFSSNKRTKNPVFDCCNAILIEDCWHSSLSKLQERYEQGCLKHDEDMPVIVECSIGDQNRPVTAKNALEEKNRYSVIAKCSYHVNFV